MAGVFGTEDNTDNEIREKSLMQWLDEMEQHEDIDVRGGVKLTREYVQFLKKEIAHLESENAFARLHIKNRVNSMKSKEGEKLKQLTILIVIIFGMMVGFLFSIPLAGIDVRNITGSVFCFLLLVINVIRWLRLFYHMLCCRQSL